MTTIEQHFQKIQEMNLGSKRIIEGPRNLTYSDLITRCRKITAFLRQSGLNAGDTIAIASGDDCELTCVVLACLRAGYQLLVLDPGAKESEAQNAIRKSKVQAAFIDLAILERWKDIRNDIPQLWPIEIQRKNLIGRLLGKKDSSTQKTYPDCLNAITPDESSMAAEDKSKILLTTSGTTASPKILKLSYANLMWDVATSTRHMGLDREMVFLNLLPLTHYDGIASGICMTFSNYATIVRLGVFSVPQLPDVFDAIYKYRVTHLFLTPSILSLMLRFGEEVRDMSRAEDLKFVISTAATLPEKLWKDFEQQSGKRVVNIYGLSETGNYLFAGPDDASHRIGSIGKPVDGRILIVDEQRQKLATGTIGEILIAGECVIDGYLDQPAPKITIDGLEWFETGDLGYVDDAGFYWLSGRKKNIIIVGGRNVYPDEINDALLSHPSVEEAATIGITDEIWGERVVSCVVAKGTLHRNDLLEHASKLLNDYKVPRELHILPELPKGRSGKVQVQDLIALIQKASAANNGGSHHNLEKEILVLASRSFRVPEEDVSLDTNPQNCSGWDSVAHMDFVVGLEEKFSVDLLPKEIIQITNVAAAVRLVRQKLST